MSLKISVVIPVYNVEKYLRECLDSLINQTYNNLEIICIDDCSKDNSFNILQEYAHVDERIRIFKNEENLHAGPTRNKGLEIATGEYIHFMDSDDILELDAYEKLVNILENNKDIEVLTFGLRKFSNIDGKVKSIDKISNDVTFKVLNIHTNNEILYLWKRSYCNALYSKEFLLNGNIKYNSFECFEDCYFSLQVLLFAKRILITNYILYNYRKDNPASATANWDKHLYCVSGYFNFSKELCQNIEQNLKIKILKWDFDNAFSILEYLYVKKLISFADFKKHINLMDFKELTQEPSGAVHHALDLLHDSELKYNIKRIIRKFSRTYFPTFHKLLIKFKSKFKHFN